MSQLRLNSADDKSLPRYIDWMTLVLYFVMVAAGAVSIYAATNSHYTLEALISFDQNSGKQLLWAGLSFVLGLALLLIDKRLYDAYAYPFYALMIIVLIATAFIATDIKGSRSWLTLGPVSLQPAEFAKTATALCLAKLFDTYGFRLDNWKSYAIAGGIIVLPMLCIVLEHETGSALVYSSLLLVLYREGMSGLVLFAMASVVAYAILALKFASLSLLGIPLGIALCFIVAMVLTVAMLLFYCRSLTLGRNVALWYGGTGLLVWLLSLAGIDVNGWLYFGVVIAVSVVYLLVGMLHDDLRRVSLTAGFLVASVAFSLVVDYAFQGMAVYQQKRILVTLGVEDDPKGYGYNVRQSQIAIGSGGLTGKGFMEGTQTKLKFVPEQHTDFIFCTIGEEQGFVGSMAVLLLFAALILRCVVIAERQHSTFARVYSYCVACYLLFHLFINVGMVLGITPVIGIPLPLFSYGGSSMWGFTLLLFIMLRLDADR
ncbi:MAG: rod shape-determining protein RodA [Muribaculaceae bacterium]|nr:rod shape-determining protein RodA [Muribaculaceae bacterium]